MGRLEGQAAIIVGAGSGMGRATALAFAEEGAAVALAARRPEPLEELAATVKGRGGNAIAQPADLTRREEVDALVQATLDAFGHIDVLVNTAGINVPNRKIDTVSPEDWQRVIANNLTGAYHCTQAVLPAMRRQRNGLIIHISSTSGIWGDRSGAAYQASKHGIVGLAYATMFEERLNGIRVSVVYPGLCDTPMLDRRAVPFPREERERAMAPEDVAAACLFLASLPPRTYVPDLVMMASQLQCVGQSVPSVPR